MTDRNYFCINCKKTRTWIGTLYDALFDNANGILHTCDKCSNPLAIELKFYFKKGAGDRECKVLASFLPDNISRWKDENDNDIYFYPFMIIVEALEGGDLSFWLPYWHIVKDHNGKVLGRNYGQWAPFMDEGIFASLLDKAKIAGYLS